MNSTVTQTSSQDRPGLAARIAATRLVSDVLDRHRSLDALLGDEGSADGPLSTRDRALTRAIVGITLRRHGNIRALLAQLIARPPEKAGPLMRILEVAAAQLLFMDVPDHAAVSLAMAQVTADRTAIRYKALANAVLRRIARERDALKATFDLARNTPEWLFERWQKTYGRDAALRIAEAHLAEPPLDLSVKSDPAAWAARLGGTALLTGTVRLLSSGPVDNLAGYHEGAWWVQDAAAALPPRLLGDVAGKRVADLCAAPGGKTAALANAGANVVAVDASAPRLERVTDTLRRLRLAADVVHADVLEWQPGELFDAVLLDAPCTATGTIRRHPDIPYLKRPADIPALAAVQARMIEKAVALVRPGGTIVYATCSLEPEEGEAHVAATIARLPVTLQPITPEEVPGLAEAVTPEGTLRTLPFHLASQSPRLSGLDGFFVMRLTRR